MDNVEAMNLLDGRAQPPQDVRAVPPTGTAFRTSKRSMRPDFRCPLLARSRSLGWVVPQHTVYQLVTTASPAVPEAFRGSMEAEVMPISIGLLARLTLVAS